MFGSGHYGEKRAELESIHEAIEKQQRVRITYAREVTSDDTGES